jgi:methyl-accepting chemotaxis protein
MTVTNNTGLSRLINSKIEQKRLYLNFKETTKLFKNCVYVSPLEFNQERGIVERLFKPIIRYAIPI